MCSTSGWEMARAFKSATTSGAKNSSAIQSSLYFNSIFRKTSKNKIFVMPANAGIYKKSENNPITGI
jgi:hypothetical protein